MRRLRWGILLALMGGLLLGATPAWKQEVQQIDEQIQELKDVQDRLRLSAEKKANDAMRWQFQNENYMDARRAWDQLALQKKQIEELQSQIDLLEARKEEILRKHAG